MSILDTDSSVSGTPSAVLDSAMETIKNDFSDILGDKLEFDAGMACPPMKIHMRDDLAVKPLNVKVARQVPLHLRDMANKVVSDLVDSKRITRVTVPTDWCSPAHFVPKPCGKKVRLVTDYRVLNNAVRRPVHPFPSATNLIKRIAPDSRFFCKLDAIHRYYQVPLDKESSFKTTFLICSGRYRYKCAPMGLSSTCLLYTSPSPRDLSTSRMPSSA